MSQCKVCGRGPEAGVTVYRENPTGELPAVWACREHRSTPVAPDDQELIDVIEGQPPVATPPLSDHDVRAAAAIYQRLKPAATPPTATPDTGEAPSEYRAGPLRYAFIKGVRLGVKSLTNGEVMTEEDAKTAAKLAYPDEPITEPRIVHAAPTTPPPTATLGELLNTVQWKSHRCGVLDNALYATPEEKAEAKSALAAARAAVEERFAELEQERNEYRNGHQVWCAEAVHSREVLTRLRSDVERLQADAARLDYFDANPFCIVPTVGDPRWRWWKTNTEKPESFPTFRAAIDAARIANDKEPSNG